jgi:mono/diheme cytochrome c family protein
MKRVFALFAIPLCAVALYGAEVSADSTRGAQVFEIQGCGDCHSLNGVGPSVGPDLSRLVDRGFTPASLAATMWNHAPGMWTETRLRGNARPALDEQQAADLFAFFYSLRFFEEPGDAGRGKALFSDRKCAECHGITSAKLPDAKPVMQWTAPADPLALVETMWNHSTKMRAEMERRKIKLPRLSGQELADLLVYVRSLQKLPLRAGVLQTPEAEQGKALFVSKTCASCHDPTTGFFSLQLREETLTDIASDMWNHGFDMSARKMNFQPGDMHAIAAYIWSRRLIENYGKANVGANVFVAKKCGVCHDDPMSGAPPLTVQGHYYTGATIVSGLTRHGPLMLNQMRDKHLAWPQFTTAEMSDLIAYLNVRSPHSGR